MKAVSLTIVLAAFVAALAGAAVGRSLVEPAQEPVADLHVLLYDDLKLQPSQHTRLKDLEHGYMREKAGLEQTLRDENADLARAIQDEHGYGPKVEAAVDQSHHTMGKLQKVTLEHIFAMRTALTPEQAKRYDQVVTKLLVDGGK